MKLIFNTESKAIQSFRFHNAGNFIQRYQPKQNYEYKALIRHSAEQQIGADFKLLENPLKVQVEFVFPELKSFSKSLKKRISEGAIVYKNTKPDLHDNLCKATFDALTGIVWEDDSQVAELSSRKYYGIRPKIIIEVHEIGDSK